MRNKNSFCTVKQFFIIVCPSKEISTDVGPVTLSSTIAQPFYSKLHSYTQGLNNDRENLNRHQPSASSCVDAKYRKVGPGVISCSVENVSFIVIT